MLNYGNLSDYEFELLCQDVMSAMLGVELRSFSKGRDGGIDLCDRVFQPDIVVQIKHYVGSRYTNLYGSLKKELTKVQRINPKQYYICTSCSLSAKNIDEVHQLFSNYMIRDRNIITLIQIDEFLNKEENREILRKHYKLWLDSTKILGEINNQAVFIDCESLLAEIEEEQKLFVQTRYYRECRDILDTNRILLILGMPGSGKTMTTKMLALYYAASGYAVRYTTDGDIYHLKNALSADRNKREIIILDDFLGQTYYKMKDSQENEILSLIRFVSMNPNKILLMNSRMTIYSEARERSEKFEKYFVEHDKIVLCVSITDISTEEKGLIFYNHLFFRSIPREFYENILIDKGYRQIVTHKNYTPRIMEHVTTYNNLVKANITYDQYTAYCLDCLINPEAIWKNEYNVRITQGERLLLTTLYSLTDDLVDADILKRCYERRLIKMQNIDKTINHFDKSLTLLNGSMLRIVEKNGHRNIGVINPSVNDFLRTIVKPGSLEYIDLSNNCTEYAQIRKLCFDNIIDIVSSGRALELQYANDLERTSIILSILCMYGIKETCYKGIILEFLRTFPDIPYQTFGGDRLAQIQVGDYCPKYYLFLSLCRPDMTSFYGIENDLKGCLKAIMEIDVFGNRAFFDSMILDDYGQFLYLLESYTGLYGDYFIGYWKSLMKYLYLNLVTLLLIM